MQFADSPGMQDLRAAVLESARHPGGLCVLSGTGMSAESGIPTFREALTGHWARFDPMEWASEPGFRSNPGRVWDWYAERRAGVRRAAPNAGHLALGAFALRHPGGLVVITQNVDDLHQRAGNADTIRLHGGILRDRWLDPCARRAAGSSLQCLPQQAEPGSPPTCAECGNRVRPGVVWFGEALPPGAIESAERAVGSCRVLIVVGTSGAVWPAAGLAGQARSAGSLVLIFNPDASEIDGEARRLLRGTAAQVLCFLLPVLLDEHASA